MSHVRLALRRAAAPIYVAHLWSSLLALLLAAAVPAVGAPVLAAAETGTDRDTVLALATAARGLIDAGPRLLPLLATLGALQAIVGRALLTWWLRRMAGGDGATVPRLQPTAWAITAAHGLAQATLGLLAWTVTSKVAGLPGTAFDRLADGIRLAAFATWCLTATGLSVAFDLVAASALGLGRGLRPTLSALHGAPWLRLIPCKVALRSLELLLLALGLWLLLAGWPSRTPAWIWLGQQLLALGAVYLRAGWVAISLGGVLPR